MANDDATRLGGRWHITMSLEDAEHFTEEDRQEFRDSYPDWERDARTRGIPQLGSGAIFPIDEDQIKFKLGQWEGGFPEEFASLAAVDLGDWDHPTAGVWGRYDRETDTIWIHDAYRRNKEKLAVHCSVFKAKGKNVAVAWPHDALKHDKNSGETTAQLWRNEGVKMLPERVTHPDGSFGVEAGITNMLSRMQTGRLRVATHLEEWFEEFRLYHRKEGRIVKEHDDLMDATRYLVMMIRKARVIDSSGTRPKLYTMLNDYDPLAKRNLRHGRAYR